MFMKLLVTGLVIAGAVLVLRLRRRSEIRTLTPAVPATPAWPGSWLPRVAAYVVLGVLLAGFGWYLYHQWQDAYRVVSIQVIDSRSGRTVVYQAYKGDISGRSFETTDGRVVTLAEVERMELGSRSFPPGPD